MKKEFKFIIFKALAFASISAVAGGPEMVLPPPPPPSFDGFYVGAGIGASIAAFKNTPNPGAFDNDDPEFQDLFPDGISFIQTTREYVDTILGTVFIGGGYSFYRNFYASLEVGASAWDLKNKNYATRTFIGEAKSAPDTYVLENRTRSRFNDFVGDLDLRLGYVWGNIMPYVKVGGALTSFRLKSTTTVFESDRDIINEAFSTTQRKSSIIGGWRVGAGLETFLTPNWSLRGEYVFTDYGRASLHDPKRGGSGSDEDVTLHNNSEVQPYTHTAALSLVYRLNFI